MAVASQAIAHADGTLAIDLPLPPFGGPAFPATMGMRRSSLHKILADAVTTAAVQVRCGTTVQDWQGGDFGVDVQLSDGGGRRGMRSWSAPMGYPPQRGRA